MSEQELSPWGKEKLYNEKKLRKHEKKLSEQLQEAQEEQAEALERLRRAEERMRKRMAQVQYLEERLNIVHQQMEALQAPHGTVVTMITAGIEAFAPMLEAPSSSTEPVLPQAGETASEASLENSVDVLAASPIESSVVKDGKDDTDAIVVENVQQGDGESTVQSPERFSDLQVTEVFVGEESVSEEEMPTDVGEAAREESVSEEEMPIEVDGPMDMEDAVAEALFEGDGDQENSQVLVDDLVKQAQEARVVAEAAEEAARVAIERAVDTEEYLEQVGAARHLIGELEWLQTEANQAIVIAREAEEAARLAIERAVDARVHFGLVGATSHLMQELEWLQAEVNQTLVIAREAKEAAQVAERLINPVREEGQQENAVVSHVEDEEREELIIEMDTMDTMDTNDATQSSEPAGHPSPLEVAQVEEIEEEEEDLETVAAMIIADAAGIAAAQAEAEAEASSARTREARALALKADQALENVRAAIRQQKLSGEGAEIALRAAEREATHAHAVLADAEGAEERALKTAMNAEAEAEVAEGMAFAASSRDERDEKLRDENASV